MSPSFVFGLFRVWPEDVGISPSTAYTLSEHISYIMRDLKVTSNAARSALSATAYL
jgi:hypothetical protein